MTDLTHDEAVSYINSGFSKKMGWGAHPALLLVDACIAYWEPTFPLNTSNNPAAATSPASMKRLLDVARVSVVPVVWTRVEYEHPDMRDAGMFWLKSKSLDIFQLEEAGLTPIAGEAIISKKYPSAFFGTELVTRLHVLGVDMVVVCGGTSGCVRASVLDAMQYGYMPMIHNANLFDLNAKYSDLVSEEEAVGKLQGGNFFRAAVQHGQITG
ncbi:N-carbamoylsarcosine amidase [Mycena vulgaris]|nr:N-carbamoylsarcosine amidase [Mycena vulgaris]